MEKETPKKRPGIRRLVTVQDCRRFLARCIKQYHSGEISEATLRTMAYSLEKLVAMIKAGEHEERLEKLENQLIALEKEDK